MKLLGLVAVLAIVYFAYSKRLGTGPDSTTSAMKEYEQTVSPTAERQIAPSAPVRATSNVRRPIDATRSVLEKVKKRNGDGEF